MKRKSLFDGCGDDLRHAWAVLLPLVLCEDDIKPLVKKTGLGKADRRRLRYMLRSTWAAYRAGFIAGWNAE